MCNKLFLVTQFHMIKQIKSRINTKPAYIHNAEPLYGDSKYNRLKTCTTTGVTLAFPHKSLNILAHKFTISFFVPPFEIRYDPFIGRFVTASITKFNRIGLITSPIQNLRKYFSRKFSYWHLHTKTMRRAYLRKFLHPPSVAIDTIVRPDRTFS